MVFGTVQYGRSPQSSFLSSGAQQAGIIHALAQQLPRYSAVYENDNNHKHHKHHNNASEGGGSIRSWIPTNVDGSISRRQTSTCDNMEVDRYRLTSPTNTVATTPNHLIPVHENYLILVLLLNGGPEQNTRNALTYIQESEERQAFGD